MREPDGSYRAKIKASDHKDSTGNYRADAYVVDTLNNRHYVAEKIVAVDYVRPSGTLSIENNNTVAGTFDAVVRKHCRSKWCERGIGSVMELRAWSR